MKDIKLVGHIKESEEHIRERIRKQPICQFDGITVDMDYELCCPSVHAMYQGEEIIISVGGSIREQTENFPKDKANALIQWVLLHKQEIEDNHYRRGHRIEPLIMIDP